MRIASLIGKTISGDLIQLGAAEGGQLDALVGKYNAITAGRGKVKDGKRDLLIAELHLLATATAGGELKARRKFNHPEVVA
jgi:hypothetical protein